MSTYQIPKMNYLFRHNKNYAYWSQDFEGAAGFQFAGHVARMEEHRNASEILASKPREKRHLRKTRGRLGGQ